MKMGVRGYGIYEYYKGKSGPRSLRMESTEQTLVEMDLGSASRDDILQLALAYTDLYNLDRLELVKS